MEYDPDSTRKIDIRKALMRASLGQDGTAVKNSKEDKRLKQDSLVRYFMESIDLRECVLVSTRPSSYVTSREIKQSVERSRRWSGIGRARRAASETSRSIHKVNLAPIATQNDFHRVILDLIASERSQCSYGHVVRHLRATQSSKSGVGENKLKTRDKPVSVGNCTNVSRDCSSTQLFGQPTRLPRENSNTVQQKGPPGHLNVKHLHNNESLAAELSSLRRAASKRDFINRSIRRQLAVQQNGKTLEKVSNAGKNLVTVRLPSVHLDANDVENQQTCVTLSMRSGVKSASRSLLSDLEPIQQFNNQGLPKSFQANAHRIYHRQRLYHPKLPFVYG